MPQRVVIEITRSQLRARWKGAEVTFEGEKFFLPGDKFGFTLMVGSAVWKPATAEGGSSDELEGVIAAIAAELAQAGNVLERQ